MWPDKEDAFDAFQPEIERLQTAAKQTEVAPEPFKKELRHHLITEAERSSPRGWLRAVGGLVSTAAAGLVLIAAALSIWVAISRTPTTAAPAAAEVEETAAPLPTSAPAIQLLASAAPVGAQFGEGIRLQKLDLSRHEGGVELNLYWQAQSAVEADYNLFVHLIGEEGSLIAQRDQQPGLPTSQWHSVMEYTEAVSLMLPEDVAPGSYELAVGLYDSQTGKRLPLTAPEELMGMSVLGLGDLIYFADEPQPIFARPEPIIPAAELAQYEVWVVNMDQAARTRATDPVELEVEIGYRLSLTEAVQMKVWYAAPDWETAGGDGRLPVDGLGELFPLDPDAESVTITFSGNAAEMARIVGTRQPVLVVQLGIPPEGEAGTGRINMLLSHTFMDQVIELNHQTNE